MCVHLCIKVSMDWQLKGNIAIICPQPNPVVAKTFAICVLEQNMRGKIFSLNCIHTNHSFYFQIRCIV